MKTFDPTNTRISVVTRKDGLMAAVGHDLELRVGRFTITLGDDGKVTGTIDCASISVVGALHGAGVDESTPGARDRAQIERTIRDEILDVKAHPEARIEIAHADADARSLDGKLTLHGVTRAITARLARQGASLVLTTTIHQPDFGIRPYSAMLGALKIKSDVTVRVDVSA